MMTAPVLLVHGAFIGAWVWEEVVAERDRHGVRATTVDLTSRSAEGTLDSDAQVVRDALAALDGPAVLVGHSYGGP
ncbi:alpha/beta fold hydrolase [Pseudonocardia sp. RS010]|uniref:alpha/beta fold hydrolase n=1 Tax=Pseudonocardia sp. RS010 TaxID=3385979 RepID=UPI0039A0B6AC